MFAHPDGIPGWDNIEKIHFIGHSMGASTIQYLQYLLRIGYFDELQGK
jgi:triacylglycerol esterase/lipase EstA (alpha/beta hydrolase family)